MRAWVAASLLAMGLAGCGFRLAGVSTWPVDLWPGYALQSRLAGIDGEDFSAAVRAQLDLAGVSRLAQPRAKLVLHSLDQRKIVSALDARGQAAEFELQGRLRFRVDAGGQTSPLLQVVAQRRLSFDPSVALAKQQEEVQIEAALRRELIELLLLRVEAELRGINPES